MSLFSSAKSTDVDRVTCAVAVITPSKKVLIAHPTGSGYFGGWTLPKGRKDEGETDEEAAVRELQEETGMVLSVDAIFDLGRFKYTSEKDYHLFVTHLRDEPNSDFTKTLVCESTFVNRAGENIREVDRYLLTSLEYSLKLLNPKQAAIFASVLNQI